MNEIFQDCVKISGFGSLQIVLDKPARSVWVIAHLGDFYSPYDQVLRNNWLSSAVGDGYFYLSPAAQDWLRSIDVDVKVEEILGSEPETINQGGTHAVTEQT